MIHKFGFTAKAGIDFPGEVDGQMLAPEKWSGTTIANVPMGQGIAVTPLQLTAAYAAIANDGIMVQPHLVQGRATPSSRQVVSKTVADQLREMLTVTVEDGTGTLAAGEGLRVAGKTGTAQKVNGTAATTSDHVVASFVGMVPADDPRLVILVTVDDPLTQQYGSYVAAPAFARSRTSLSAFERRPGRGGRAPEATGAARRGPTMIESEPVRLSDLFAGVEDWRLAGAADVAVSTLCLSKRSGRSRQPVLLRARVSPAMDTTSRPTPCARRCRALCGTRARSAGRADRRRVGARRHGTGGGGVLRASEPPALLTAGITGTNGKTTSAFLTAHLLDQAGLPSGLMGTVERRIGGRRSRPRVGRRLRRSTSNAIWPDGAGG